MPWIYDHPQKIASRLGNFIPGRIQQHRPQVPVTPSLGGVKDSHLMSSRCNVCTFIYIYIYTYIYRYRYNILPYICHPYVIIYQCVKRQGSRVKPGNS